MHPQWHGVQMAQGLFLRQPLGHAEDAPSCPVGYKEPWATVVRWGEGGTRKQKLLRRE